MKRYVKGRLWARFLSLVLAGALLFSNLETASFVRAEGENAISIETAEELAKIGADPGYPMDGDYVLAADIDLSDRAYTPMGGYVGNKGTCDPAEANVFSGTFDGQGHVIAGLTISLDGSINQKNKYGQVGFFSVIGSNAPSDYAEVKNLIFTDVNIRTDFSDGLAAVGALAGEVNGYARVSGVVVLNGTLTINPSAKCDTVGAGGVIGECRTEGQIGNGNITIQDCYNGADVFASGSRSDLIYAGGIVGRVAKSACQSITQCVATGMVQFDGYDAFGIAAAEGGNESYVSTLTDCYFASDTQQMALGGAVGLSDSELKGGTLPENLSADVWRAENGCYPVPSFCLESSAAGMIYLSGLALGFAEGEKASSVKTFVTLPETIGGQAITWSSSDEAALSIEAGKATAHPADLGTNTTVTLTARTANGYSRSFKIIVLSDHQQIASFDQGYASKNVPLTVSVSNTEGMELRYQWSVDGNPISNSTNTYTPSEADLEKFIAVTITTADNSVRWNLSTYCSELPVVYVDTEDGKGVTSNTTAKKAYMKIQGNEEFNDVSTWYEGETTIKGRGNSTWSQAVAWGVKKPYKLKLSSKANLLGLGGGKNKHWVLLANMIDHTNMRNELANNFSRDTGMEVSMGTTSVVLILNGEYQGLYELSEHVRVGKARVDVHDWEGLADDIAEAVAEKETALKTSALEDLLEQDYSWLTTGTFAFQGTTYTISDYYKKEIPEFTGGFLLDMDFRSTQDQYKYISTFRTTNGIPMFFRSPEYAKTSPEMMTYAQNYLNAYEAALGSTDFTTAYQNETVHYTDLFDLDSLLQYWLLCEYVVNWDSMKNSTYLYKNLQGKAKMGPAWDYDWAWGNINMYSMEGPFVYDQWHTDLTGGAFCEQQYQSRQWNRFLVKDPYFVTKAYEIYKKYRPTVIEDMIKEGGVIDTLEEKYRTASLANDEKWSYSYGQYRGKAFVDGQEVRTVSQNYTEAVASLKTFVEKRVEWLDQQFGSIEELYASLGNQVSSKISVSAAENEDGTVTAAARTEDANIKYVVFLINGKKAEADKEVYIPVIDGKAEIVIGADLLEKKEGCKNTVEVLGAGQEQSYLEGVMNFANFDSPESALEPDPGEEEKPGPGEEEKPGPGEEEKPGPGEEEKPGPGEEEKPGSGEEEKPGTGGSAQNPTPGTDQTPDSSQKPSNQPGTVKANKIKLSVKSKKMYAYQTLQLKASVEPGSVSQKVTYTSSKKSVASVSSAGKITAKSPGKANIIVKAADGSGVQAVCKITVQKPVLKVSGKSSVKRRKSITLTAKAYGLKGKITWKLNAGGKKLVKLNKTKGDKVKLTAKRKTGTARITISCGKKKVTKTIRIKK